MSEIVLDQKKQTTAISSFSKRNANAERIANDEAELKILLEGNKPSESTDEPADETLTAEEKSFKKRYGDLRRHTQQQQSQFQKQIDELKEQLTKSTSDQIKLPTSEDELAEWAKTYPDVARIVETIAIKKAKEQTSALDERFKALDEREKLTARERAEMELLNFHPDFNKIKDTDDFHAWADEQPNWIQQALYENDTDARAAARAIDLYKADRNIKKTKETKKDTSAAEGIATRQGRSAPSNNDEEGVIYESEVAALSSKQYEIHQEAIQKAMQSGKFVYDLSGKAR